MADSTESEIQQTLGIDHTAARSRFGRKALGFGTVILIAAALVFHWVGGSRGETPRFETQPVRQGTLTVTVTATGNLEPTNQVDVGSELSGIVASVAADYNDRVEVGQVLARLDRTKFEADVMKSEAALASARASVDQAEADVRKARLELERMKRLRELSKNQTPSLSDLETAEADLARAEAVTAGARAKVREAEATLRYNRTDLAKTVIYSPINGVVLTRSVEPGQTVAASYQAPVLFTLAEDLAQMELHVDVDEADVGLVREGQSATFTVDAYPGRTFTAQIAQIRFGSETTEGVVTYETVLKVDNSDLALRPGMTATADITVQRFADALLVPNAALRFAPAENRKPGARKGLLSALLPRPPRRSRPSGAAGQSNADRSVDRVWVVEDDHLRPIAVTAGASDGSHTVITEGAIETGMALVVDAATTKES